MEVPKLTSEKKKMLVKEGDKLAFAKKVALYEYARALLLCCSGPGAPAALATCVRSCRRAGGHTHHFGHQLFYSNQTYTPRPRDPSSPMLPAFCVLL